MDRGFGYYFGKAMRTAAKVLWKHGKIFRYYVYLLASGIGRIIPFFGAIFPVADMRLAKIAVDEDTVDLVRAFEGVERGRSFGTALLTVAIEVLLLLGGVAACGAIAYGLFCLGGLVATGTVRAIVAITFAAPAALAAVVYAVTVYLHFAPTAYILDSNSDSRATAVMTAATETMRRAGKLTCFLNVFVPACILAAYGGLTYGGFMLWAFLSARSAAAALIVPIVWLIVCILVFLACAPVVVFAASIADMCLFRDISLDPEALNNRTKGVFVKKVRINTLKDCGRDSNLEDLFDRVTVAPTSNTGTVYTAPNREQPKMQEFADSQTATEPPPIQTFDEEPTAAVSDTDINTDTDTDQTETGEQK